MSSVPIKHWFRIFIFTTLLSMARRFRRRPRSMRFRRKPIRKRRPATRKFRRRFRRRQRRAATGRIIPRRMTALMPPRAMVKLRFNHQSQLTNVGFTSVGWNGNAPRNPDQTSVQDTSAQGWTVWRNLYNTYQVYGSKIRIRVMPGIGTDSSSNFYVRLASYNASSVPAAPTTSKEFTELQNTNISTTGADGRFYGPLKYVHEDAVAPVVLKGYCSTNDIFGFSKTQADGNGSLAALTTANPTALWQWVMWCAPHALADNSTDTYTMNLMIQMTFYTIFKAPKIIEPDQLLN